MTPLRHPRLSESKSRTIHGETLSDPYFWLREKGMPEVTTHLEAENAYTAASTKALAPLQEKLYQEILSHIKQTDLSVPVRRGGYFYYSRTEEGKQYAIHCRKQGNPDAAEEILLDGNELAKGIAFLSIGAQEVSDDARLLAYATDTTGFREYQISIKDLSHGTVLPDRLVKAQSFAWAADNKTLFYVVEDQAKRPYRLYRHVLGQSAEQDELVYEEPDELYRLSVSRTRDKKYLVATVRSSETTEARYLPADQPVASWKIIWPRENEHRYSVDHRDGIFFLVTNKDAKNYKLVAAPVTDLSPQHWIELLPHRADVLVIGAAVFAQHIVVLESENAVPHLRVIGLAGGAGHRVEFPEPVYSVNLDANPEFQTTTVRIRYQSLVTPESVFDYDVVTHERKLLKQTEVPGGYDPLQFQTKRVYATAGDGTQVPVSLV